MTDQPVTVGRLTGEVMTGPPLNVLRQNCPAPAPLVVNGGAYVGCSREAGHDGPHTVTITWGSS